MEKTSNHNNQQQPTTTNNSTNKNKPTMSLQKLVLYNYKFCPFAARAVLALAETKHPYENVEIDLSVPRPDWYLKDINPYGQVPALKVNDKDIILESLFVAEYIADLHPESGLLPTDALQRAQTRYLIHHWGTHVQPAFGNAAFTLDPAGAQQRHQAFIDQLEKIDHLLRSVHKTSQPGLNGDGPFFLGSQFTFADLALASFLTRVPLVERETVVKSLPSTEELIPIYKKWLK
ncbi:putative glutathione S-transferase [Linnemannia elongata]|nr:putative glutathione S-transferase [Linnemannia elongata]